MALYHMVFNDGKLMTKKSSSKDFHGKIIKKNFLKKFETLENKLQDYLSEFVKYTESCNKQSKSYPRMSTPVSGPKQPTMPVQKSAATPSSQSKAPVVEEKMPKLFPTHLEKKLLEIERKTQNIQKYNKILEDSFKNHQIESEDQEAILLDPCVKEILFEEVTKLEEILIEKRIEDQTMQDIPEYEQCQNMLKDCIGMLEEAMSEEKYDLKMRKELKQMQMEAKRIKKSTKPQLTSSDTSEDEEFFKQHNLDNSSDVFKARERKAPLMKQLQDVDRKPVETEEEPHPIEKKLSPLNVELRTGIKEETEEEIEEDENKKVAEQSEENLFPCTKYLSDKRKLYQIQAELSYLDNNNRKFLSTIRGLKRSIKIKHIEEETIEKDEFAKELSTMMSVTESFDQGNRNVEMLIGKLKSTMRV